MWRCSAWTARPAGRCGCTSGVGRRDRAAGPVGGRCGATASGRWSWWISLRSAGRRGWCGTSGGGAARSGGCSGGAVTEQDPVIAPPRERLTTRAGRWGDAPGGLRPPAQRGRLRAGMQLASRQRVGAALGRGAHRRRHRTDPRHRGAGPRRAPDVGAGDGFRTKAWATSIVDVGRGQLLDIVPGRTARAPTRWMLARPRSWREQIRWAVLDLSGPVPGPRSTRRRPTRKQVAGPVPCGAVGQRRPRRGPPPDPEPDPRPPRPQTRPPLPGAQAARVSVGEHHRQRAAPDCGASSTPETPTGDVRDAWHAKETLKSIYDIADADLGAATVDQLAQDLQDPAMPPEINRLGRHHLETGDTRSPTGTPPESPTQPPRPPTIWPNAQNAPPSGSPTSTTTGSGALLYAGKPNWALLNTLTPTLKREEPVYGRS